MAIPVTPSAISNTAVDGRPILITDTATPGQIIYTVTAGGGDWARVYVQGWHTDTVTRTIVLEILDTDKSTVLASVSRSIPTLSGPIDLLPGGWRLRNGLSVAAWEATGGIAYVKPQYDLERP